MQYQVQRFGSSCMDFLLWLIFCSSFRFSSHLFSSISITQRPIFVCKRTFNTAADSLFLRRETPQHLHMWWHKISMKTNLNFHLIIFKYLSLNCHDALTLSLLALWCDWTDSGQGLAWPWQPPAASCQSAAREDQVKVRDKHQREHVNTPKEKDMTGCTKTGREN